MSACMYFYTYKYKKLAGTFVASKGHQTVILNITVTYLLTWRARKHNYDK